MKYREYNINRKLFGEKYLIYDWKENGKETHIYVKSQTRAGKCPKCGEESERYHATYERTIQTIPMNRKTTYAKIIAYKYDCQNENCNCKVFMEVLPFVLASQVRTTELNMLILAVSLFLSNEGASKVLRLIGIKVSNDTIKRIYDSIEIQDEPEVESVGIDDVAIRKGESYATAIYDIKDHHLIALLEGRDASTLKEWLKNHRKINLVTRDRAGAYAQAINEILPDCVQVADRFHLLLNLIERMRNIFREEIPEEIFIKEGKLLDTPPDKVLKTKYLRNPNN
jgi:transposase